jgi:hypothetical protein
MLSAAVNGGTEYTAAMDLAASALMLFPAFLIGAAFGVGIVLVFGDSTPSKTRSVLFSIGGSLAGIAVFLLTADWWPPVVGPFILCPACSVISAFAGRKIA